MFEMGAKTIIDLYTEGLSQVKDSSLSMLEQSIGANISRQVTDVLNKFQIDKNITLATVGAILTGCAKEGDVFDTTIGRILVRSSVTDIVERIRKALHSDPKIEKALKEEGSLYGITDPVLLVQQVAAIYATEAAKCSRFHDYCDDDDGGDCYRFNAPGSEGIACTLDLANLDKLDGKQIEIKIACGDKYQVDACRARYELDSGTLLESPNTPEYKAKLAVGMKKGLFNHVWPLNAYDADLSTGMCKEYILDETPITYKNKGEEKTFTRKSLHEELTNILNEEISPMLMQSGNTYNYPNIAMFEGKPCFVHPSYYTMNPNGAIVSCYSLGKLANDRRFNIGTSSGVVGSEDMMHEAPTEDKDAAKLDSAQAPEAPKDDRKLPISKDSCKIANGQYKCPRCGSVVKKNQLNAFSPKSLPEGCLKDNEGNSDLMESVKWAGSAICGPCSDQLKKVREKTSADWLKANKSIVEASKEVEALETAWVEADEALKKAEAEFAELDESFKILKDKGVPDAFKKAYEDARFNVQQAAGAVAHMDTKLKEATNKRNALLNGTAKPLALPAPKTASTTTATKSKAVVIKPAETKPMNRKQRRAAERAAQKNNR